MYSFTNNTLPASMGRLRKIWNASFLLQEPSIKAVEKKRIDLINEKIDSINDDIAAAATHRQIIDCENQILFFKKDYESLDRIDEIVEDMNQKLAQRIDQFQKDID